MTLCEALASLRRLSALHAAEHYDGPDGCGRDWDWTCAAASEEARTIAQVSCQTCNYWTPPGSDFLYVNSGECKGPPAGWAAGYEVDGFYPPADFGCWAWEGLASEGVKA